MTHNEGGKTEVQIRIQSQELGGQNVHRRFSLHASTCLNPERVHEQCKSSTCLCGLWEQQSVSHSNRASQLGNGLSGTHLEF